MIIAADTHFDISYPQEWMRTTKDPHYEGAFVYGAAKGRCYSGPVGSAERLKEMAQYILSKMPSDTVAEWWKP